MRDLEREININRERPRELEKVRQNKEKQQTDGDREIGGKCLEIKFKYLPA